MRRSVAWGWLVLAGCVQFERDEESGPTGGPGEHMEASAGESTGEPGTESGATPTTGPGEEADCDIWAQDCPDGHKCAPYDEDADIVYDTVRCVPLAKEPGQPGDSCQVEGSLASGLDDCDLGAMCWFTDEQNQGSCAAMCSGSQQDPKCPEGLICDISNGGVLILCLQPCDPLTPSCPLGQICLPGSEGLFLCDTDASGDMGAYGDACAFINVCDAGLLCAPAEAVPGCMTDGCCTEFCDLGDAEAMCSGAPQQECVPFYDVGTAPPGYEDVGVCSVPM